MRVPSSSPLEKALHCSCFLKMGSSSYSPIRFTGYNNKYQDYILIHDSHNMGEMGVLISISALVRTEIETGSDNLYGIMGQSFRHQNSGGTVRLCVPFGQLCNQTISMSIIRYKMIRKYAQIFNRQGKTWTEIFTRRWD